MSKRMNVYYAEYSKDELKGHLYVLATTIKLANRKAERSATGGWKLDKVTLVIKSNQIIY